MDNSHSQRLIPAPSLTEAILEIKPLRAEDKAHWLCLVDGYARFYETRLSEAECEHGWQRILAQDGIFGVGAYLHGELYGILHYLFHACTWSSDICYLQELFVNPNARGLGLGRALIEHAAEQARQRGAQRMDWLTHQGNATARSLYDKLAVYRGFVHYDYPL